jgi:hypothetical protein
MATAANIEVNEGGSLEIDLHLHQRQLLQQAPVQSIAIRVPVAPFKSRFR